MLAIIAALTEEIRGIVRLSAVEGVDSRGALRAYRCSYRGKNLLLVRGGVGRQRAQSACRFILDHYPVTAIVSLGFGGALTPDLTAGELIVCSDLCCDDPALGMCFCDDRLLSAATVEGHLWRRGRGLTSLTVVAAEEEKRKLGRLYSADVVDMESYFVGSVAAENRVPFLAARAVSDTVSDNLPELPSWRWKNVVPYFAAHPELGFSLYRNLLRARSTLTAFVRQLVEKGG